MKSPTKQISSEKVELSPAGKVAIEFYSAANSEITVRVRVRDTLLATYAAAAFTAIATILSASQLGRQYLYGLPYLALAFTLLVSYHHAGIGTLGTYCAKDLLPALQKEVGVLGFAYSSVYHQYHRKNSSRRVLAHGLILLLPPGLTLVINFPDLSAESYGNAPHFAFLWILTLALMIISYAVIHRSNRPHFRGIGSAGEFAQSSAFSTRAGGGGESA